MRINHLVNGRTPSSNRMHNANTVIKKTVIEKIVIKKTVIEKKNQVSSAGKAPQTAQIKFDGDIIDISKAENLDALRDQEAEIRSLAAEMRETTERMRSFSNAATEAIRENAQQMRLQRKAMRIARRIMNGDNVPMRDHKFLREHNPALYSLAMSSRRLDNDDPKDYAALSNDERRGPAANTLVQSMADMLNAAISAPSPSAPAPASSGEAPIV